MSQAMTRNCWKQFPPASIVAQPYLLRLFQAPNPSLSHSPRLGGCPLLEYPGKEEKTENTV